MKLLFVINPISGKGKGRIPRRMIKLIDKLCRKAEVDFAIRIWDRPERIGEIVTEAIDSNFDAIIAAGGDGTINEIGKRLVGHKVALGIIPKGSGNGYARHLGYSRRPKKAISQILSANRVLVDTGEFGGVPFMNTAGVGIDAEVAERYSRARSRGIKTYIRMGIKVFMNYKPFHCRITIDGKTKIEIKKLLLIDIANGTEWGGGAKIAPHAKMTDGLLEAIILEKTPFIEIPKLLAMLFMGTVHKHPDVRVLQGKTFSIERPRAGSAHVDGESINLGKKIDCRILEKSVNILVPQKRENI